MPRKRWSMTVGAKGYQVTLIERAKGRLSLRLWNPLKRNYDWRALKHGDRELGEEQARNLSGQLLAQTVAHARGGVLLVELFGRYEREVSKYRKGRQPKEHRRRMDLWQLFLGDEFDVVALDHPKIDEFVHWRRAESPDVRAGTIGADIVFLQAVLNWATRVRLPTGKPLLTENAIRTYERPRTSNPRQPVVSYDRFLKLRKVADQVDPQHLFGPFLDLVEDRGWRVSALCGLWASDVDRHRAKTSPYGRLRKRGALDKEGVEMWVPLTQRARQAIDLILKRNPVVGDRPLFPSPRKAERPWSRYHARDLLERAEKRAKLEPIAGGDFHPFRRKWATERKALPTVDVMAAGGWRDERSLKGCYQQIDPQTLLAVVSEPSKLRERNVANT